MYVRNFNCINFEKKVVIGTTGFSNKQEKLIKNIQKKFQFLKPEYELSVNFAVYLTEIYSRSLGNNFLNKVYEVHHKHKKRSPIKHCDAWKRYSSG